MNDDRRRQLLEPTTRSDDVGAVLVGCLWAAVWVGVFVTVGQATVMLLGLTGTARTAVEVVAPAVASVVWIGLLVRAARRFARRRRLVREEFTDPPPRLASPAPGASTRRPPVP